MPRDEKRITNLADLGAAFGLPDPLPPRPPEVKKDFFSQPIVKRLRICGGLRGEGSSHDRKEKLTGTIVDVLKTDKKERARLEIKPVIVGDLDSDGALIVQEYPVHSAQVFVLFPGPHPDENHIVNTNDVLLAEYEGISIEEIVNMAGEIRQETTLQAHGRHRLSIKSLDNGISKQKTYTGSRPYGLDFAPIARQVQSRRVTKEMERLNGLKTCVVWDFLQESLKLEKEYPHLQPQFVVRETKSDTHLELVMWSPSDRNVVRQIIDPATPPNIRNEEVVFFTNINVQVLLQQHAQFERAPQAGQPQVEAGHHIWDLLSQRSIRERHREIVGGRTVYQR